LANTPPTPSPSILVSRFPDSRPCPHLAQAVGPDDSFFQAAITTLRCAPFLPIHCFPALERGLFSGIWLFPTLVDPLSCPEFPPPLPAISGSDIKPPPFLLVTVFFFFFFFFCQPRYGSAFPRVFPTVFCDVPLGSHTRFSHSSSQLETAIPQLFFFGKIFLTSFFSRRFCSLTISFEQCFLFPRSR